MPSSQDSLDQAQFISRKTRQQKFSAHAFASGPAKLSSFAQMTQKAHDLSRAVLYIVYQVTLETLGKLHRNATGASRNDRLFLPKRFRDYRPNPSRSDFWITTSHPR